MEKTEARNEQVSKETEQYALEHRQRFEANRITELRREAAQQPTRDAEAGIHRDISSPIQERMGLERNGYPSMGDKTSQFRPDEIAHIRSHASGDLPMQNPPSADRNRVQEAVINKLENTSESEKSAWIKRQMEEASLRPDEIATLRSNKVGERSVERISEQTRLDSAIESMRKNEWLEPSKWKGLDVVERRIALEHSGKALMDAYECPDPPLMPREFPEYDGGTLLGFYQDGASIENPKGEYDIALNERLLAYDAPHEALKTYGHEFRHAYQHEMATRYEKGYRTMVHDLDVAGSWHENFQNYHSGPPEWMDADDPRYSELFKQYNDQVVEKDAREFSENLVRRLYEQRQSDGELS